MSEKKERFTKVSGGKMYLSEEVDRYIEIVGSAYSEALEELDELKEQKIKDSENFKQEQEKIINSLAKERQTSQKEIADLNERLKSERISKDVAIAKANDIEKTKTDNTGDIEKISQALEAEKEQKALLQKQLEEELAEATHTKDNLQNELNSEKEQNALLQKQLEEKLAEQEISLQSQLAEQKSLLQSELDKVLEDNAKLQQEKVTLEATLNNGSLGHAGNYIDLLKRTSDMADAYVRDIEEKMDQLEAEAKAKVDEQLNQSQNQVTNIVSEAQTQSTQIIDEATSKADKMIKKAEAKRQEILTRTRTEYEGIRGLIEQASKEYANMATTAKEEDIEWDS